MFKIEKCVPIPVDWDRYDRKYPLRMMEVGDSFAIPVPSGKPNELADARRKVSAAIGSSNKTHKDKRKFTTHMFQFEIRVWRVK